MDRATRRRLMTSCTRVNQATKDLNQMLLTDASSEQLDLIRERFVEIYNEGKEGMYIIDMVWSDRDVQALGRPS